MRKRVYFVGKAQATRRRSPASSSLSEPGKIAVFALGLLCFAIFSVVHDIPNAVAQQATQSPITYFYKNPDLDNLPRLVEGLVKRGTLDKRNNLPPVVGFLAALFERHPDRVDEWIAGQFSSKAQRVIGLGLAYSGHREQASAFAERNNWPPAYIERLKQQPDGLDNVQITGPTPLDIMWGASFATGDALFVNRILDMIEEGTHSSEFSVADILLVSNSMLARKAGQLKKLKERLGDQQALKLIPYGVALWAMNSNANQHAFIAEAVQARIKSDPTSDLAHALQISAFGSKNKIVTKASEGDVSVMVSQMPFERPGSRSGDADADIKMFIESFKNRFGKGQPVYLAVLIKQPPQTAIRYSFEVTSPSGQRFTLGPYATSETDQHAISSNTVKIDPENLSSGGVYVVQTLFHYGIDGGIHVENKFLVSKF